MRNKLRRLWAKWRLRRICKVLGIIPYSLVEKYILRKSPTIFSGGRANGKTMACVLDTLVYKRVPPDITDIDLHLFFYPDPDYRQNDRRRRNAHYLHELTRAVEKCEAAGLDVGRGWRKKEAIHGN